MKNLSGREKIEYLMKNQNIVSEDTSKLIEYKNNGAITNNQLLLEYKPIKMLPGPYKDLTISQNLTGLDSSTTNNSLIVVNKTNPMHPVLYKAENTALVLYKSPNWISTPVATNRVPLLTDGANKVSQVQSTLIPKANVNNIDLLKAFKRVEGEKNYYYSKLTITKEVAGVKFRFFPSIEYALNERAAEELQKNPLTMPIEIQEHIFGEIKHLRNGTIRATGGHAVSDQVKISDIINIQYNNVFQAKVEIYDSVTNQFIIKSNNNGISTLFPPYWTKDRVLIEAESAFKNKKTHSDINRLNQGYDEGKTKSGVKVDIGRKTLFPQENQ